MTWNNERLPVVLRPGELYFTEQLVHRSVAIPVDKFDFQPYGLFNQVFVFYQVILLTLYNSGLLCSSQKHFHDLLEPS